MLSFSFEGKDSYLDYGIIINNRPTIPAPKKRVSYIDIPGRHSRLVYDAGTFEDITVCVECTVKATNNLALIIDEIKAWLFGIGESDLIFSFQPDKRYRAQVVNAIDFKQVFKYTSRFPILFNCRPFKYLVQNNVITITNNETNFANPGSIESEPIISVFGTGDIVLNVNGNIVGIKDLSSKIILNSVIQDAYDEIGNSLNIKMTGEFVTFLSGINHIKWLGNVEKIEVIPNWRWI